MKNSYNNNRSGLPLLVMLLMACAVTLSPGGTAIADPENEMLIGPETNRRESKTFKDAPPRLTDEMACAPGFEYQPKPQKGSDTQWDYHCVQKAPFDCDDRFLVQWGSQNMFVADSGNSKRFQYKCGWNPNQASTPPSQNKRINPSCTAYYKSSVVVPPQQIDFYWCVSEPMSCRQGWMLGNSQLPPAQTNYLCE